MRRKRQLSPTLKDRIWTGGEWKEKKKKKKTILVFPKREWVARLAGFKTLQ